MLAGLDAQFGKAVDKLRVPFADCRQVLDAEDQVETDDLSRAERLEGFAEVRAWFESSTRSVAALPPEGQVVLGRILLGQTFWRLEALGRERLEQMRGLFKARLGHRVKFTGERRDDLHPDAAEQSLDFDPALVPPRLREHPQRLELATSRAPMPPPNVSLEDYEAELFAAQDRAFLNLAVPALGGKTPREAARDPALRPKLIHLLKSRIRSPDEQNLRTGRRDDLDWLLRELGLEEIRRPPPPRRPRLENEGDDDEDAEDLNKWPRPPPPPLRGPLTPEEARRRLRPAVDGFDTAADALDEVVASGASWLEDLEDLLQGRLQRRELSLFIPFALQAWFALVPPGSAAPHLSFERLARAFTQDCAKLLAPLPAHSASPLDVLLEACRQPALTRLVAAQMLESVGELPPKARPRPAAEVVMLALLKSLINETDLALQD